MSKSILQIIYSCSVQKTAVKKTKYSRNETIFKIGHDPKAIAHAKSSLWVKNYNSKTHVKIHSINQLQLFGAKNRFKKHQIFEKWDYFQNRPSCKGYSPCKILTLAQKLKFKKTCQNIFYKSFIVVLFKKPLHKTPNTPKMRPFSNPHFGSKIKVKKNISKSILQIICSYSLQKNRSKKPQIFEIWDYFQNRPSCKGLRPFKIFTLSQKLKFQKTCQNIFYKSFTVVLYKKPLQKTPNIWEMRPFSKSAIMQRL